jgi:hypothetical protein
LEIAMSALGQKQTWSIESPKSASLPKSDIVKPGRYVRFVPGTEVVLSERGYPLCPFN